jgi:hypothetical protein
MSLSCIPIPTSSWQKYLSGSCSPVVFLVLLACCSNKTYNKEIIAWQNQIAIEEMKIE